MLSMQRMGCVPWGLWGDFRRWPPLYSSTDGFTLNSIWNSVFSLSAQGCFTGHLSTISCHDKLARIVLSEWGLGVFRHKKWRGEKGILWQSQGSMDLPGLSYPHTSAGTDSRTRGRQRDPWQLGSCRASSGLCAETVSSLKFLELMLGMFLEASICFS